MLPKCGGKKGLKTVTVSENEYFFQTHHKPLPAGGKICVNCKDYLKAEMEGPHLESDESILRDETIQSDSESEQIEVDPSFDVDQGVEPPSDVEMGEQEEDQSSGNEEVSSETQKLKTQNKKLYKLIKSSSFHSPHARKAFVKKSRYQKMERTTKWRVDRELARGVAAILEAIFPIHKEDRKYAWENLKNSSLVEKQLGGEQILGKMWREIIHATNMCRTYEQKVQLLSNFVPFASYPEFAKHNIKRKDQGIGKRPDDEEEDGSSDEETDKVEEDLPCFNPPIHFPLYQKARKHYKRFGYINAPVPKKTRKLEKITPALVDQIVDFISSEEICQNVAYGTYTLRDNKGNKKLIAKVQRKQSTAQIIRQVQALFADANCPPSERTIRRILKIMKAGKSKDVKGIDGTLDEERKAFKNLHSIMDELHELLERKDQLIESNYDEVKTMLSCSENYIKSHFIYNIVKADKCINHCINFAVSDANDEDFRSHCNNLNNSQGHDHSGERCKFCDLFPSVLAKMRELVDLMKSDLTKVRYDEMHYEIDSANTAVNAYKKQLMRNYVSSSDVEGIFLEKRPNVAVLTADFAMKVS